MDATQALVLGIVQGLTEFLPVSSTAHLRLVPHFLGWPDPGTAVSAVIQLGTLLAVFVYFAADVKRLAVASLVSLWHRNPNHSPDSRLAWAIVIGTLPIAVLGLALKGFIETGARSIQVIAWALIVLAVLLLIAERVGKRTRPLSAMGFWQVQLVGLCQALALIPGCSRSGSTIMGGLFLGLKREDAAYFSFVLGLPAVAASGLLELRELLQGGLAGEGLVNLGIAIAAAAISGYAAIGLLLRFLQRHGTYVFSIYRIVLGIVILLAVREA